MDRIQAMQVFTRVAEAGSFVRAAETLSLPSSTVTSTIKNLEKYLQVRLLNRTTRRVSLTPEGLQYLAQCREILSLIEHSQSSLTDSLRRPQGRLRVDMPGGIAHFIVMPHLKDFYRLYPDIYLMIGVSDRQVDLVQEGVDCVIRTGELTDSTLVARPLGRFRWVTCASPDYLRKFGVPETPEALSQHRAIHYFSGSGRRTNELRFTRGTEAFSVPVEGDAAVNETGLYIRLCLEGFGLAQLAENVISENLQQGKLIEVLADWQPPSVPVTPVTTSGVDEEGFRNILARLTAARVDSLGILGSTGSYAFLTREQRKRIATLANELAGDIPMMVCVGAVSTDTVLRLAEDAQAAGADALLLPAVSYQPLRDDEVFALFETVTRHASVPVCVYDNPGTTHFTFTDELHGRLSSLDGVRSVKIPGVPDTPAAAVDRVAALRHRLRPGVTIGISGDAFAGLGLNAGCEVWYSVCGGLFPETAKQIVQAAAMNDPARVTALTTRLEPLWALYRKHGGSIRVIAAAAGVLGLTDTDCLPRPLQPLPAEDIAEIARVITELELK